MDMMMTFLALLLAYLFAAFVLPSLKDWPGIALQSLFVAALSALTLGLTAWPLALAAGTAHLVIAGTARALPEPAQDSLTAFAAQHGAHIFSLMVIAYAMPDRFAQGLWAGLPLAQPFVFTCGAIIAILVGGPAIGRLMQRFTTDLPDGLTGAGRLIGALERTLIFALVMVGEPTGIGFLIAAKSILRFDTAKTPHASEYVIVGTLASFGWALIASLLTLEALEIAAVAP